MSLGDLAAERIAARDMQGFMAAMTAYSEAVTQYAAARGSQVPDVEQCAQVASGRAAERAADTAMHVYEGMGLPSGTSREMRRSYLSTAATDYEAALAMPGVTRCRSEAEARLRAMRGGGGASGARSGSTE